MYLYIVGIISFILLLNWFCNYRERALIFWNIPEPPGIFLIANGWEIIADPVTVFANFRKWAKIYKNQYRQWIYPYGVINIYNPDDAETILSNSKNIQKSLLYDFLKPWLHDGLLLSKDSKWQTRRKILTPAFHFNILRQFTTTLEENSWKFMNKLNEDLTANKTNVTSMMSDITLNSMCETSMGTKLHETSSSKGRTYKEAIHEMGKLVILRTGRIWLMIDFFYNLSVAGRKQKQILKIIHNFPKSIIQDRRNYILKNGIQLEIDKLDDADVVGTPKRRMAMLDLLISAESDGLITEEGIQEEVDTFMFEGHDTTAVGLSYALMELANNKHIQINIMQELYNIFGNSMRSATMQDLSQMKYLECCIKESLRLYPPVPFISRRITEPITLSDGHVVPSGRTICNIHIFDLHRRADLYEDPSTFKPERFLPENNIGRHPYAYLPFSAGPRNCIGQRFAMLQMKSVLSAILRNFELKPVTKPEDIEFSADLVLRTTKPVYVKFVRKQLFLKKV